MPEMSTFEKLATLQRGFDLPVQDRRSGTFPIISSSGISGSHDEFMVQGPGVVTGRSGTIGLVHYSEGHFWPLNTTLYVKDFKGNHPKFVALVLESMDLKNHAAGSTVPSLNRNVLRDVAVWIPTLSEQRRIVDLIDAVDEVIEAAGASRNGPSDEQNGQAGSLRCLRTELLSVLLSGAHRIPETYDELMGA